MSRSNLIKPIILIWSIFISTMNFHLIDNFLSQWLILMILLVFLVLSTSMYQHLYNLIPVVIFQHNLNSWWQGWSSINLLSFHLKQEILKGLIFIMMILTRFHHSDALPSTKLFFISDEFSYLHYGDDSFITSITIHLCYVWISIIIMDHQQNKIFSNKFFCQQDILSLWWIFYQNDSLSSRGWLFIIVMKFHISKNISWWWWFDMTVTISH